MALVEEYVRTAHARPAFVRGESDVEVSGRVYDSSDVKSLTGAALEFWLTSGHFNDEFQQRLSQRTGIRYALTTNSGSSANLTAFSALTSPFLGSRAIKPGDEVITAACGFPTTVNPALLWGATPVFVDVELPGYNAVPETIEAAITPQTRAIVLAHTLGNPFAAPQIAEIARRHDLYLIEDCCDALGATIAGRHVGNFGDLATLSFYPAHHITTGEGGAVLTNSSRLRRIAESFRDWGRDCYCEPGKSNTCKQRFGWQLGELPAGYDHKYIYSHAGFNLKMTDLQASIGVAQMDHLEDFLAARRRNFAALFEGFTELEEFFILPQPLSDAAPAWFGFPLTLRDSAPFSRNDIVHHLNRSRIATRYLFGGNLVRQPYMQGREFRIHGTLATSDLIMRQCFWIGVYPGLGVEHIAYMIDVITDYCRGAAQA